MVSKHSWWIGVCGCLLVGLLPSVVMAWSPFFVRGRCQKSRVSCRSTLGNAGGRFACCDPAGGDALFCAQRDPCVGTYRYHWDASNLPLKWWLNHNNMAGKDGYAGQSLARLQTAATTAFDAWTKPSCSAFRHAYQGASTKSAVSGDRTVTITFASTQDWARLGASGALAFAQPFSDSQGRLRDGDIYVSPLFDWGTPPVAKQEYDLTDVLTHEIGHSLGLAHSPLSSAVMYYSARGIGPLFNGLGQDDRDGICSLYPLQNKCKANSECAPCFQCIGGTCTPPSKPIAKICRPCASNQDCGTDGVCVTSPAGGLCLQKCFGSCCPTGYQCKQIGNDSLCVPLEGYCPTTTCQTDANCGSKSVCDPQLRYCRAPDIYDYKLCHKDCATNADCGSSLYQCVAFGSGQKRCVISCANHLCPRGFACRETAEGRHCLPADPDFCPCRSAKDCPTGRICRQNICVSENGGQVGEACSGSAPCDNKLQCEALEAGSRCVYTCANQPCPTGFECKTLDNFQRICVKAPTQELGENCDGLLRRCKDGFTCIRLLQDLNEAFCVETCSLNSSCQNGGSCNLENTPRMCQCSTDGDCGTGFKCQTLSAGIRVCQCSTKPCQKPCGNGVCEAGRGENCDTCSADCGCQTGFVCNRGFCRKSAVCGDGTCEAEKGENCSNCNPDCGCGFGAVCHNNKCSAPFCGDGDCRPERGEDCSTCLADCKCKTGQICQIGVCASDSCGNGTCEPNKGENCSTCAKDCGCQSDFTCKSGICARKQSGVCGDGLCEVAFGETCFTCLADCGCKDFKVCLKGVCESPNKLCSKDRQQLKCETGGTNCTVTCVDKQGCGCSQRGEPLSSVPWFMLLLFGMAITFRRRTARDV